MSARELLVLAAVVAIALVGTALARAIEWAWSASRVAVIEQGDALPPVPKLNINTAKDYELAMLPGIGPKTALAIVEYRQRYGPFAALEDIMNVERVGSVTLEAVRPYVTCGPLQTDKSEAED